MNGQLLDRTKIYQSPLRLLALIALSIFFVEAMVMFLIHLLPPALQPEGFVESLIDSLLLVLFLSPVLFYFFFRPLLLHISERRRTEETLQAERDRLESVTQSMGAGLAIISRDRRILWANTVLKQMLGDIEGQACYVAMDGKPDICVGCVADAIFDKRKARVVQEKAMAVKGKEISSEIILTPLTDKSGNITAALELILPITERKQAEAERARLEAVVKTAAEAIIVTDRKGFIQYVNPAFSQITGHDRKEVIGRDLHLLDTGGPEEALRESIRETVRKGEIWRGNIRSRKKDGTVYYEESTVTAVKDGAGKIINYVTTRRDITEKLRLESIAEAVSTMNNIGCIFSGIRHEIGNPINTIKINLSVLSKNLNVFSQEKLQEYVSRMLSEVGRIEYLLNMLKNFNMYENLKLMNLELTSFTADFLSLVNHDPVRRGRAAG